jgi:hypothetical protein
MPTLPPRAQLQPIIARITERLASAVAGDISIAPDWSDDEWRYAQVVAHIQGIAPLLHAKGAGAWQHSGWSDFLAIQHRLNGQRNARILALAHEIIGTAAQCSVPLLALKGVQFATRLYPAPALRPMADIDLFTPAEHEATVTRCIEGTGYTLAETLERHRIFVLPPNTVVDLRGEHPDNPIKLELHTRLYDNLPRDEHDLTPLFERYCRRSPAEQPALTDLLAHALMHASSHMMKRSLRFITLYDLYLMAQRLTAKDWAGLCDTLVQLKGLWWAYPPVQLLLRYFPSAVPQNVQHALVSAAPRRLRNAVSRITITDASVCNVRPQYVTHVLQWARSPREAVLYLTDRLSGRGRTGWQTAHKWTVQVHAFAPTQHPYRRALRWLNPQAYRGGTEEMFGGGAA